MARSSLRAFFGRFLPSLRSKKKRPDQAGRRWRRPWLWLEPLEDRLAPVADVFTNPLSGAWSVGTNWSLGAPPISSQDATVTPGSGVTVAHASGTDTVHTLSSDGSLVISGGSVTVTGNLEGTIHETTGGQLTLNGSGTTIGNVTLDVTGGGIVNLPGTLNNTGNTLTLSGNGVFNLSGSLVGGTVTTTNGATLVGGGTLDGVTLSGNLNVGTSGSNAGVTVKNGLTLNGTVTLGGGSNFGYLDFSGTQTLGGSGTVVFAGTSSYNGLLLDTAGTTLTIGSGITVHGASGYIGYDPGYGNSTNVAFINQATISADTSGGTITLYGTGWSNSGTLGATGGGTLNLAGTALTAGTVQIGIGGQLAGTLTAAILNGNLNVGTSASNAGVTVKNGLTLNGTVTLGGGSNFGYLDFSGTQTLGGTGTVVFAGTSSYNGLLLDTAGTTLTIGSGITVHGASGYIGYDPGYGGSSNVAVVNQGTIQGDSSGKTITVYGTGNQNAGSLNALNGGTLSIQGTLKNTTTVLVDGASVLSISGTLTGGTIAIQTGGDIIGSTLDGVTLNGNLNVGTSASNAGVTVKNGLTLNGTVTLGGGSNFGYLDFSGTQTLGGTGTVVFAGTSSYNGLLLDTAGTTLTIGSGITVHGASGYIGYDPGYGGSSNVAVVNQGTIQGDSSGKTITVYGTGNQNAGSLNALNGGTLSIQGTLKNTTTVLVDGASVLSISGTLTGGTIAIQTGGDIIGSTLDGVTLNGNLNVGTSASNAGVTVKNGLTLNGTVTLGGGSNFGYLDFSGTQTLGGTGTVVFAGTSSYNGLLLDTAGTTLTIGSGITVHGANGYIGYDPGYGGTSNVTVVNQGTVQADTSGKTITVYGSGNQNTGTLKALNGATLSLQGSNWKDSGVNYADATSAFSISTSFSNSGNNIALTGPGTFTSSGSITGGTLSISSVTTVAYMSATLDGVTINGNVNVGTLGSNAGVTVKDGLTLNGTATLGSSNGSTFGYLEFNGTQSLTGTGSVVFGGADQFNALWVDTAGTTLTVSPNITVHGNTGYIGNNSSFGGSSNVAFVNQGTISADTAGGTITLNGIGWSSTGTIEAKGGTVSLNGTSWSSTGINQSDAGGVVILNGSVPNNNKTLALTGVGTFTSSASITGGTLSVSSATTVAYTSGTLDGVTINGDVNVGTSGSNAGVTVKDGLTLNGTATLGSSNGSTFGYLEFNGTQSLTGTGSVVFGGAGQFNAVWVDTAGTTLTIGPNITVHGSIGYIGNNPSFGGSSNVAFVNQGTISADTTGGISLNGTNWRNDGTLQVSNGGTLNLNGTAVTTGIVQVSSGGNLSGTLFSATINGDWEIAGNFGVTVKNGLTLNGTVTLGSSNGSTFGYLEFNGTQSLTGTGSVVFGGADQFNALWVDTAGTTLSIGPNITVHGRTGYIGNNPSFGGSSNVAFVNQGTISADTTGGTITLNGQASVFTNLGSVDASLGTINISTGTFGTANSGTLSVGPTGTLNVTGPFTQSATGNFNVVLGGSTSSLYGHAAISGTASLNGTLNVSEANNFSPGTGNIFTILTYTSATGQFANYTGLTLAGTAALQPAYNTGSTTLTTVTSTTIAPDLRVTNVALNPANPQSSQNVTVNWKDFNAGNGSTGGSWTDHVVVTNTTSGQTFVTADVPYGAATSGNLASNASTPIFYTFRMPDGSAGVGNLQVAVTTDYYNTIAEYYPGNVGETNNTTTITTASTLAAYPDLQVSGLAFAPSNPLSGQNITILWNDANTGQGATAGDWSDQVTILNTTTGQTLVTAGVPYSAANSGNIAAGGTSPQLSYTYRLPDGLAGVGVLQISVTTNVNGDLYEYNAGGTATSNNTATVTASSSLSAYADLTVANVAVQSPASPQSGNQVTVGWDDANGGNVAVSASFSDNVLVQRVNADNSKTTFASGNVTGNATLAAGAASPQTFGFTLPDGVAGTGTFLVTVTTDSGQTVREYDSHGNQAYGNNTNSGSFSATLSSYADLTVANVAVQSPALPQSGNQVTVSWGDNNVGNAAVSASFNDSVLVQRVNADNSKTTVASGNVSGNATLAAGAASPQTFAFTLPDGAPGTGNFLVTVTADSGQTVKEYDMSGNAAYGNNTGTLSFTSTIAKYPDLQVTNLAVDSTSVFQSGGKVVLDWNDANTGNAAANKPWYDQVTVVNTTTGQTLVSAAVYNGAAATSPEAAGSSVPLSFSFLLPNGSAGVGNLAITVTTEVNNSIFEYNPSGTGQTNNTATLSATSVLAAYPDLATSNVTAPTTAVPGQQITVGWTLANNGTASANGPWTEQVLLAADAAGDNATLLGALSYGGPLAAGQSVPRAAMMQIPNSSPGNYWLVVSENPLGEVFETNSANNTAVASQPTNIPSALMLALANPSVSDGAGANATTATVSRNTDTSNPLVVTLANSNSASVSVPQTMTIPAGQTSVTFPVGTINSGIVVGTQTITLTASAAPLVSGTATLTVTDVNVPTLTLSLGSHSIDENAANPATMGTVARNTATTAPLVVSLLSNSTNKLQVPANVTIPAGQVSVTFPVTVVNDNQIDGNTTATVTAASAGFVNGSDSAVVVDDNIPTLGLTLAQQTVSEAAQNPATTGTVTIGKPASQPITITLTSSDTTAATVPATVVIGAGQTSASFPITAIDDGLDTGDKTAVITANVESTVGVILNQGSANANLLLKEADSPALSVTFAVSAIQKGSTATATVTRNTNTTNSLVVNLLSSDPSKATVPATVTIPAGQASVSFTVTAIDDHTPDGLQQVQITASASGLDNGIAPLGIIDVDLPDLVVASVTAPTSGYDNTPLTIAWTVTNSGQYLASGAWVDQVYFDPVGGPQNGTPADTVPFSGTVNAGQSYTQTDTLSPPPTVGLYLVRVVADANQSVQELSFANNTGASAQPLNDQASYSATVTTSVTTVSSGTAIPLSGVATLTSIGTPAADVPVAVQIMVAGTTRTLTATTDSSGHYSITFQPLQNEAGEYSVTAADPGVTNPPVQLQFEIVGMTASPANTSVQVIPGTPLTGQFTLTNLSDATLTGLTATSSGGPAGLTVQLTPPSQLAGNGTATLAYSLTATLNEAGSGEVVVHITSTEGAVLDIPIDVSVLPLTPMLATDPSSLESGMVVGAQSLLTFTVVNNGGAASGALQVGLPNTSYLSLASPAIIPSLAPGASSTVTLQLTPPSNLPLAEYTGTITVSNGQTGISVPFMFTATTSAVGDVHVLMDDDFTTQESGSPHVQGATVSLLNPYDNSQVVATGMTDATGAVNFTNIPAGPYDLQVKADGHATYEGSYTVVAGITNNVEPFIQRQFVTYTWVVQPTPIQDSYEIDLKTTFETEVPAPVVTITAPASIPILAPGQSGSFNVTLTNQGLIAAQGITLNLPTDPEYTFAALTTQIGTLSGKSSEMVPITVSRAASSSHSASGSQTLVLAGTYFYVCGNRNVSNVFMTTISVPGRTNSAQHISDIVSSSSNYFASAGTMSGRNGSSNGNGNGSGFGSAPTATNLLPPVLITAYLSVPMKLELSQGSTPAGEAVTGTLTLNNEEVTGALQNIEFDVTVTDSNGNPASGVFIISAPTLGGALTAVNGTGTLAAMASGTVAYTFIPDVTAAPRGPTVYNIGGTLRYFDPATGGEVSTPLVPYPVTVNPVPQLKINYFLQKDVVGDDPFTPQIEPSEPAVLGMLVTNTGAAPADQLSLTSPQPQVVQIPQTSVPLTFQIISSQVGSQTQTPSLTANFGDVLPGQTGDAAFYLLSSLQGEFLNFTATFSHSAPGGTQTSVISSVQTHTLIHAGNFLFPGSIGAIDYLVDDVPNTASLPDTVYLSDGSTAPVSVAFGASASGTISNTRLSAQVTAQVTPGWDYIQLPDPGPGYTLYAVVRSDGVAIPVSDQTWTTDRTFNTAGMATVDHELHILDVNSTGSYTVYFRTTPATAPTRIVPTAPALNNSVGGVDLGYQVTNGPSLQDTSMALYWSSGTQLADTIGNAVYTMDIPAGTASGIFGPFNVPPSTLGTAPQGAKYLLAVTDPSNLLGNFEPSNNVLALTLPKVVLNAVTDDFDQNEDLDPNEVILDYTISDANITQPLVFNVYESDQPSVNPNSLDSSTVLLAQDTIDPSIDMTDLTTGPHEIDLALTTDINPDPSAPYLVVDADPNAAMPLATGSDPTTATRNGYSPQQINTAYAIAPFGGTPATGSGQTIAIVVLYNDPNLSTDVAAFDKANKLPAFSQAGSPRLVIINQDGGNDVSALPQPLRGKFPSNPQYAEWAKEATMDVEWAHAIAPGANIVLIECSTSEYPGVATADAIAMGSTYSNPQLVGLPCVSVVSMSWGGVEATVPQETAQDSYYFNVPGVTYVAASGDNGSPGNYPAFSPDVLAVGGTSLPGLDAAGDYPILGEQAWNNAIGSTGSGTSTVELQPPYQNGVVPPSMSMGSNGKLYRTIPDVSFDADPLTGVSVYDSYNSAAYGGTAWTVGGGTSLGAPSWAGLIAIVDQERVAAGGSPLGGPTQSLPALYSSPSIDFHDITSGSNGTYDAVTGLGTPVANLLVPYLAKYATTTTLASSVNPSVSGQLAFFTATVTSLPSTSGSPTGSVQFQVSGVNWGPAVPLVGGMATSPGIPFVYVANYNVTADFISHGMFLDSSSPAVMQVVNSVTSSNLQNVIAQAAQSGGPVTIEADPTQTGSLTAILGAVNGLQSPSGPVTLIADLEGGTYTDQTASPPSNVNLVIQNGTLVGSSPALTVSAGHLEVLNCTLITATDAPTILLSGGSLSFREDIIQESTAFSDAAIELTGGTLDLGTTLSPGGNVLNINGTGAFVENATSTKWFSGP